MKKFILLASQVVGQPLIIQNKNGVTISGVRITNPNGDCVQIINSTNVTIEGSGKEGHESVA